MLMPGGVTLPPEDGEDAGKIQSIGARYAHGEISLVEAAEMGCRACASPGGGCQFLGNGRDVAGRRRGPGHHDSACGAGTLGSADLARPGPPIGARAGEAWPRKGETMGDVVTDAAIRNAMVVHAAFGGSTNLLLHIPAIAFAAGLRRPTVDDWHEVNLKVPRLVSVLAQRAVLSSDGAGLSGRRRARGHASPEGARSARSVGHDRFGRAARTRARVVGDERAPQGAARPAVRAGWSRSRRRDHESRPSARARLDEHRHVSARQPGAGGLGDQEHGDRPERGRRRTVSIARPARRGSSRASTRRSRRSRGRVRIRFVPATCWC